MDKQSGRALPALEAADLADVRGGGCGPVTNGCGGGGLYHHFGGGFGYHHHFGGFRFQGFGVGDGDCDDRSFGLGGLGFGDGGFGGFGGCGLGGYGFHGPCY